MAAQKRVAVFVNLCHSFMKEVGMPNLALDELLNRAGATITTELESFQSVMFWKHVTANFYALEEKIAMGPFNPDLMNQVIIVKPQIPDLNKPAPENEGPSELVIIQDDDEVIEVEAATASGKRKTTQTNHSVDKRLKVTADSAGPTNNDMGKGIRIL